MITNHSFDTRDFTLVTYRNLIESLKNQNFIFKTFSQYLNKPGGKSVVARHDVDYPKNSALKQAQILNELGVSGTFYFRVVNNVFNKTLITRIHSLGHEIGYHYEDLALAKGNTNRALASFEKHLQQFREIVPVSTICMHGSPLSPYDNKQLWDTASYRSYGIVGEPYLDIDFDKVFYLTDTGGRWDGESVSIRDKVSSNYDLKLHSSNDIIDYLDSERSDQDIMFNFHPHRWTDNMYDWMRERYLQKLKNAAKFMLVKVHSWEIRSTPANS